MTVPEIPENETLRLQELESFQILDTLPDQDYDNITKLASEICDTPISLITLIDEKRQWFKSKRGLSVTETPRHDAFCAHGILKPTEALIIENAHEDVRFKNNPLVTGDPNIDFYAGIPLVSDKGYALGSLCVIDTKPHTISPDKIAALKILARQVVNLMELHKKIKELRISEEKLNHTIDNLKELSNIVAHDIKAPIRNMKMFAEIILDDHRDQLHPEVIEHVDYIVKSADKSQQYLSGLLDYSKKAYFLYQDKTWVDLNSLLSDITFQLTPPEGVCITYSKDLPSIFVSKAGLHVILTNLIDNAVKYCDEKECQINIEVKPEETNITFRVSDNSRGIPKEKVNKIFSLFYMVRPEDALEKRSTGIGLAVVQKIVNTLGGKITVDSRENKGSTFIFSIPI